MAIDPKIKEVVDSLTMSLDRFVGEKATPATFKGIKAQIEESVKKSELKDVEVKFDPKDKAFHVEAKLRGLEPKEFIIDEKLLEVLKDFKDLKRLPDINHDRACDVDGKEIAANDRVIFVPRTDGVAKKCRKLIPHNEYRVAATTGGSVVIKFDSHRSYYKSTHFKLKEKYKSDLMKAIEGL